MKESTNNKSSKEPVSPKTRLKNIREECWKLCDERDRLQMAHLVQDRQDSINARNGEYQGILRSLSWFRWRLEKFSKTFCGKRQAGYDCDCSTCKSFDELLKECEVSE